MASMISATLKWGKEKKDLQIDPTGSVAEVKANIQKLTGVPIERQKLSCPKAWKVPPSIHKQRCNQSNPDQLTPFFIKKIFMNNRNRATSPTMWLCLRE